MIQTEDYYSILKIRRGAPKAEITASYRRLCKLYHGDINSDPEAEELMKVINQAYHTLKDDGRRKEYDSARFPRVRVDPAEETEKAKGCVNEYFNALLINDYGKAYAQLSRYDRRYVTQENFRKWRESVQKVFLIREYSVSGGGQLVSLPLDGGVTAEARLFSVAVTERNRAERTTGRYTVSKYAVKEAGVWRVFLGYRDLNEIIRLFDSLNETSERAAMEKHWAEHRRELCIELDMLSLDGLLKRAEVELYRYARYRSELTVACFAISPAQTDVLEACARTVSGTVRTTDVAAYAGNGLFAVLYAEMKKKHAANIVSRLASSMRAKAAAESGANVLVTYAFETYAGGDLAEYAERVGDAALGERENRQ